MANSITLAEAYLPIVDSLYKVESKSAVLDAANSRVRFIGANAIKLFKLAMSGYGDYSRSTGFPAGSVAGTWEALTLSEDRGVSLTVDSMDNEETMGQAFGALIGEFVRTQMIPELDCYRFAKYATAAITAGNVTVADITVGTTDVAAAIDEADEVMQDNEVPANSYLFVSPTAYRALKSNITRNLANEGIVDRNVETYNDHPVIVVPKTRFSTGITLNDGSSDFGFETTGYSINFMLVHPAAVAQVVKHNPLKVFGPNVNQDSDGWKFQSRCYHDAFILDNKVNGIYVHRASTAL